jgi:hypothetical protein
MRKSLCRISGFRGLIETKIRGVEQELAMNTVPSLPHESLGHLVGMAVEELKNAGLVTSIRVEDERSDFMALNGFRVYDDMSHLELSSPSYNSPLEAVVYDKVAELFAFYAVRGLKGYFKEINVYKNNVSNQYVGDDGGTPWRAVSYSTHSSILMDRRVCNLGIWDEVEAALIPFMVARIPLIGGGDLVPTPGGDGFSRPGKEMRGETLRFAISPRALFAKKISSNDTVSARGLLNQRDDPHADPERYWRLHDCWPTRGDSSGALRFWQIPWRRSRRSPWTPEAATGRWRSRTGGLWTPSERSWRASTSRGSR